MLSIQARFMPETMNEESRSVEMVFTTSAPARMGRWKGWDWEEFNEILSMTPEHVRLDRMKKGAPLLNSHYRYDLSSQLGVVEDVRLVGEELRGTVRFSKREDVEPFYQDVKDGIIRNASIGYRVHKYNDETPDNDKIKTLRAVDWEPFEISLVTVPADANAGVRSEEPAHNECEIQLREIQETNEGDEMGLKKETQTPEQTVEAVDAAAVRAEGAKEGAAQERKRVSEIQKAVRAAKLEETFASELIEQGVSVDHARAAIIEKWAEQDNKTQTKGHIVEVTRDERETRVKGIENALMHRYEPSKNKLDDNGRQYRSMSLLRIAEEMVGDRARHMTKTELASRALSTSDFSILLGNVAGKSLRSAYDLAPKTFMPFVRIGTLPDYKEMSRIQFGDIPDLEKVYEGGEYKYGSIGEGAEKIKLAKYGKKIRVTEETIINDDLGAFTRMPAMAGAAGARLETRLIYTDILLGNPKMSDNVDLFHGTHGNLPSASVIDDTNLGKAKALMRKMKALDGKDYLNLVPAFLVCGPDKESEALKILNGQILAAKSSDVNIWRNSMDPIIEATITGNKWFVIASPSMIDTIELSYLEGMAGPEITTTEDRENDSVVLKIKHVVGAKAIDYRGMIYNAGA